MHALGSNNAWVGLNKAARIALDRHLTARNATLKVKDHNNSLLPVGYILNVDRTLLVLKQSLYSVYSASWCQNSLSPDVRKFGQASSKGQNKSSRNWPQ